MNEIEIKKFMHKISNLMYISLAIWIVIIVMQFFIGISTIFVGYGFATLCLMVYNLVGCIRYCKNIKTIKNYSSKYEALLAVRYFENSIPLCWVFMFINLFLGGFIGFFGNLFDLIIAYYVKSKKASLLVPSNEPDIVNIPNPRDYE